MSKKHGTQKDEHLANLTDDEAREYIESLLWTDGAVCAYCGSKEVYKLEGKSFRPGLYHCRECRQQFTVTVNTIMHATHIPLRKWVRAFHLMCSSKKGISASQLHRNLGLGRYLTGWRLAHRTRLAMRCEPLASKLKGTVEVDETFGGGHRCGIGKKAPMRKKRGL